MRKLIVKQLSYDLTPVAGLALVGHCLESLKPALSGVDAALSVRSGVRNSDILRSYLGLLTQGKSDFDAIEAYRGDAFYKSALGIGLLPSSPTLRQRMDACAQELFDPVALMPEALLAQHKPDYGLLACGYLPLDVDTFVMDNSDTHKEDVGRTYTGVDGYCPLAAYLGQHGFCLELALRPGSQHSARETELNFERLIPTAQRLSAAGPQAPILARMDSGFDSQALMRQIDACNGPHLPEVHWLIKWNPRSFDVHAQWCQLHADKATAWHCPRPGKRVTQWEETVQIDQIERPVRRILRLTERTTDKHGQLLIEPQLSIDGWTTTLPKHLDAQEVIELYDVAPVSHTP